jgi:hypothetical protein
MGADSGEFPLVSQAAKLLCESLELPYVVDLKSSAFGAAMGPEWVAKNPLVPILLTLAESKTLAEGKPLDRKVVLVKIEKVLSLMPIGDRSPAMSALREVYRDIFMTHVPGFWDRLKAGLASGAMPPPEVARVCILGLNLWHCDPAQDPGARDLWGVAADAFKRMGAGDLAAQMASQAAALGGQTF